MRTHSDAMLLTVRFLPPSLTESTMQRTLQVRPGRPPSAFSVNSDLAALATVVHARRFRAREPSATWDRPSARIIVHVRRHGEHGLMPFVDHRRDRRESSPRKRALPASW